MSEWVSVCVRLCVCALAQWCWNNLFLTLWTSVGADICTDTVHKTHAFIYVWTLWTTSAHVFGPCCFPLDSEDLQTNFGQFVPVPAGRRCLLHDFFFSVAISKIKWKLRGQVVMIRSYSNSYSAIHTPKGTRVQQEIRTTHMKRNNSNYWQWFSWHFCQE